MFTQPMAFKIICLLLVASAGFGCHHADSAPPEKQPAITKTYAHPVIAIETSKGTILAELFEDKTPNTVANIIVLAESGFYDGLAFHRIIQGFMAQCGCPYTRPGYAGDEPPGSGGPGYRIAEEYHPELKHVRGCLNMAKTAEPNTTGSQFCIFFRDSPHLDGKHTVFGRVIEGMDVVDELNAIGAERDPDPPKERVTFNVRVVSKNDHAYTIQQFEADQ